jgi:hypothetical protein
MKSNSASSQNHFKIIFGALIVLSLFNAAYGQDSDDKRQAVSRSLLQPRNIDIQGMSFWDVFDKLTATINFNIVFDASVQPQIGNAKRNLHLENVSYPQAIGIYLNQNDLGYIEMDERTIMVVKKSAVIPGAKPLEDFVVKAGEATDQAAALKAKPFLPIKVVYRDITLRTAIEQLANTVKLAVVFDPQFAESIRTTKVVYFTVQDTIVPRALQLLLDSHDLKYEQIDQRTIKVGVDLANPSSIPLAELMAAALNAK